MKSFDSLNIGMDAKRALCNGTGLGNYSRYAVNILSAAFPSCRFMLYSPRTADTSRVDSLLARQNVLLQKPRLRMDNALGRAWWRSFDLPLDLREDGVDIYHGLSNEIPFGIEKVCPSVVTIHDVIYRRCPADYSLPDRKLYDFKYGRSAKRASRVIAISECTRRDIIRDYDIDPAKIDVIYQGIDPIFSITPDFETRERVRKKYDLPPVFILSVGTVQARKNLMLALRAMVCLPESVRLIVIGRMQGDYADRARRFIADNGLADRVRQLKDVPFADLPAIYSLARLSAYPSRYEGFGLPVVESLAMNTPVIAATGSCLEEAGGPGAVYVDPDDVDAFVARASEIIDDTFLHDKLAGAGRRYIRKFSPEAFAKATMATYKKALIDFL